ncbi:hypothetical protein ABZ354_28020, partial [Streptomyces sp. NPDC005925]|uniref:hypothetical protein n=1 Tax=Streptomyces sp. NPDC005925 TaxID=3157172 RepID=UPI0033FA0B66
TTPGTPLAAGCPVSSYDRRREVEAVQQVKEKQGRENPLFLHKTRFGAKVATTLTRKVTCAPAVRGAGPFSNGSSERPS